MSFDSKSISSWRAGGVSPLVAKSTSDWDFELHTGGLRPPLAKKKSDERPRTASKTHIRSRLTQAGETDPIPDSIRADVRKRSVRRGFLAPFDREFRSEERCGTRPRRRLRWNSCSRRKRNGRLVCRRGSANIGQGDGIRRGFLDRGVDFRFHTELTCLKAAPCSRLWLRWL